MSFRDICDKARERMFAGFIVKKRDLSPHRQGQIMLDGDKPEWGRQYAPIPTSHHFVVPRVDGPVAHPNMA